MKFFKKGEWNTLWPFYLDAIISPMLFFIPIFLVIYFLELGYSLFQIGLLISAAPLTSLIFEIPTGAVADLYGRKFSVLLGMTLEGIGVFLLYFFTNFYAVLALFALIGFGATFSSGAGEAWVTDFVKYKRKHFMKSYFVKSQSLDNIGFVVSGFVGAFLVSVFGVSVIWLAATASIVISVFILSFAKEHFIRRKINFKTAFHGVLGKSKEAVKYSRRHRVIFYFLAAGFFLVLAGNFSSGLSWIPFLQNMDFPDYAFGFVWSGIAALGIAAPLIANKIFREGKERMFILVSISILIVIPLFVVFAKSVVSALSILFAVAFMKELKFSAQRTYFHSHIPTALRASIGSVEGMLYAFVGIFAPPLVGFIVDSVGPQYAILISGIITIPSAFAYYFVKRVKKVEMRR